MKLLWAKIVIGFSIFCGGAIYFFAPSENRDLASIEAEDVFPSDEIQASEKPNQIYKFEKNHLYEYEFYRKVHILGLNNSFPPIELRGKLYLQVVKNKYPKLDLLVWNDLKDLPSERIRFRISVDQGSGKIELFSDENESHISADHKNILKDLLANFFYFSNEDTVGKYQAKYYFKKSDSSANQIVIYKKNKQYEAKEKNTPEVTEFLQKIEWDHELQFPLKITAKEQTKLGSGEYSLQTDSRAWLKFQKKNLVNPINDSDLLAFAKNESFRISANHIPIEQHPEYQKIDWNTILRELKNIEALSESDKLKLFGDIVKALKLDKSRVSELLALIEDKNVIQMGADSPQYQAIVGALATNGSAESQRAIIQIYENPLNPLSGKGSILGALTTTQAEAHPETIDFLKEKADTEKDIDLRQGSLFALGGAIEKKPQSESEIQFLLRKWNAALASNDQDQQLALLDAMGNSGRSEFFFVISQQAKSSMDSRIRARAIFALRGIKLNEARMLLVQEASNQSSVLRFSAISAIQQAAWGMDFEPPLKSCVVNERENSIREACIDVLTRNQIVVASK
jgi:HEAT repeat protein